MENGTTRGSASREIADTIIRIGVAVLLIAACIQVIAPFAGVIVWALILAIALYPAHCRLALRLGGRQGLASALIVLIGLAAFGAPTVLLGGSFAAQLHEVYLDFQNDALTVPEPDPAVAAWPVIGPRVHTAWTAIASDLPAYLVANKAQLQQIALYALGAAASTAGAVALFLTALIVAAVMMAFGDSGSNVIRRILCRLTDAERGLRLQRLSAATVRSVATGVIGVAFIQALLLGIGLLGAGVPAAGILAFLTLLIAIMQLPAALISLPAIVYIWWAGDGSTATNVAWSAYLIVAGLVDNVLKPLLLGRGVEVPMPVILIGALGGMVWGGIVGLFVGAVLLAVGYQLLTEWIDRADPAPEALGEALGTPVHSDHDG
jgi:predicted PurR-regulated permease PerM